MIDSKNRICFNKIQVGALHECIDLELNGYRAIVQYTTAELWYIKLKHRKNGNVITIRAFDDRYIVKKNDEQVKECRPKL